MTLTLSERMSQATRLTKAGRLGDALALLQGKAGSAGRERNDAHTAVDQSGAGFALNGLGQLLRRARAVPTKAPLAKPDRFERHTFSNEAGSRSYRLYVPGRRGAMPLVVMLHGCSQSPEDFAAGTQMNALAEEHGFLVAYPGQTSSANAAKCWNWFESGEQVRDRGEPSLIAGITRQIMREHKVDPSRVYVAGLSAGGAAAAIMGQAYPDLYAAIGVHSGLACGAARTMGEAFGAMSKGGAAAARHRAQPLPTIVFHGDRDHTVSHLNGDHVIAQSKAEGVFVPKVDHGRSAGGVAYTRTVQANRSGQVVLEQWVLHGSGHAWSGGHGSGSFTDPRGPDASREMVRFFLSHARS